MGVTVARHLRKHPFAGRHPFTYKRGGSGFVGITQAGSAPIAYDISPPAQPVLHALLSLALHTTPSIAADHDGYAVVTEKADQYGPGCWYSKINDSFAFAGGPASIESTQQADCDSSTVSASAGPAGAGIAWLDRDPVNAYAEFRGTAAGSGVASLSGELPRNPIVTATSTGFALLYRAQLGVRVFDAAGRRTLVAFDALADLVTWADRAIVVWSTPGGQPQLTRLCPGIAAVAPSGTSFAITVCAPATAPAAEPTAALCAITIHVKDMTERQGIT